MAITISLISPPKESMLIDAGETLRKPLSLWPRINHSAVTNALWQLSCSIMERNLLDRSMNASPNQRQLVPKMKTPSQSRTSILYKFSADHVLREKYRDPCNEVRIGKLLEDLDALACTIALTVIKLFYYTCCGDCIFIIWTKLDVRILFSLPLQRILSTTYSLFWVVSSLAALLW